MSAVVRNPEDWFPRVAAHVCLFSCFTGISLSIHIGSVLDFSSLSDETLN